MINDRMDDERPKGRKRKGVMDMIRKERIFGQMKKDRTEGKALL